MRLLCYVYVLLVGLVVVGCWFVGYGCGLRLVARTRLPVYTRLRSRLYVSHGFTGTHIFFFFFIYG